MFNTLASEESASPVWDVENWRPRSVDYPSNTKAYNDFAQGGHVESDRNTAKRGEDEAAEACRKKREMDHFDAMFGGSPKPDQTENIKILRTETDNKGVTRTRYQETYIPFTLDPEVQGSN